MSINLKKVPLNFNYTLNSIPVNRKTSVKDLGVLIDTKLNFSGHIQTVKSKAMSLLGLLYRYSEIKDPQALRCYFTTIVLPVIAHCSPIWAMSAPSNLSAFKSLTNFFSSIVKYRVPHMRNMPTNTILTSLSIHNLPSVRLKTDVELI